MEFNTMENIESLNALAFPHDSKIAVGALTIFCASVFAYLFRTYQMRRHFYDHSH